MLKAFVLACATLFLLVGCNQKTLKCDSKESKELVLKHSEKKIKTILAMRLIKGAIGDEWESLAAQEERDMVEFNYKEYGPILSNIKTLSQGDNGQYAECSAELLFRNEQKFFVHYKLQKDSNEKLDATVEWR